MRVHGIVDRGALDRRVPTVSISVPGMDPAVIARRVGEHGVFVSNGTGYAISVIERLGLTDRGGVVRLGCVHYNSRDEVETAIRELESALG